MDLFRYQKVGIKWMVNREMQRIKGGFLCDEMGLGKTVQTLCTCMVNRVPKTLVIVPNSLVDQWVYEIENITDLELNRDIFVTTYSKFLSTCKDFQKYMRQHWDRIILDEGHEIRTKKSKRFKNICEISSDIRWVLTGTPIYNRQSDYNTLLKFVAQDAFEIPSRNEIMLRRTKEDVGLNIPKCHFENVELEMYPEEFDVYKKYFNEFSGEITKKSEEGSPIQLYNMLLINCLLRVRQLCTHPTLVKGDYQGRSRKMDELVMDIKKHPDEKSIVFCNFHKEMDIIQSMIDVKTFRLDGSVPSHMRTEILNNFKKCSEQCVLVIQIKTGGQGLNIQEATRVYIMSPSWNPATELQAIARCHRTGQKKEVYVKKFIYISNEERVNCVDESIVLLQEHKSVVCAEVLNDRRLLSQIPVNLRKAKFSQVLRKIFEIKKKSE